MKKLVLAAAAAALTVMLQGMLPAPAASSAVGPPADVAGRTPAPSVRVMTRNLYLGADIQRPIVATTGKSGADALVALGNANHEVRRIVDRTDFATRAALLAIEIKRTSPDLVGLQEVALWRSGPIELPPTGAIGVPNATTVDQDFLAILLERLARRGEHYTAVSVQTESDIEAPSFLGDPFDGSMTEASDQRLTMRDVVLRRDSSPWQVTDSGSGSYQARLPLDVAGLPVAFVRGYNWVDVRTGTTSFRFVNTHLEAFSSDLALLQVQELLAGAGATDRSTVLVCDCNSDPLDHSVKPTDPMGTPHSGPYDHLVTAGFVDGWLKTAPADQGLTSGLSETVDDVTAAGFTQRIDLVTYRPAYPGAITVLRGRITGNEVGDRDRRTGLWPSDHAGVMIKLRIKG